MADNFKIARPKDYSKVDVNDPNEMVYWTKELGVSKELIIETVKQVGTATAAVRRHIRLYGKDNKWVL